ncbi:MAG TPA: ribosomal protein S18-alanine N-acetyltransferase [Burkholderiales bacterium]|nr:ribosomal protein S18-alanine N-acetyltransferase [Burkholderiales bacterium]
MSARPEAVLEYRRMRAAHVARISEIEDTIYTHPWTPGNFRDSVDAGYECWVLERDRTVIGYAVMMVAAGEAHLLNLSIASEHQGRGLGEDFVRFLLKVAREGGAERIFLEVRPSNAAARALYAKTGFTQIGVRRDYYPARPGREDAIVMERAV